MTEILLLMLYAKKNQSGSTKISSIFLQFSLDGFHPIALRFSSIWDEFLTPTRAVIRPGCRNTQFIAVAYNQEVIAKEDYSTVLLDNGDSLEIVKPVGGG